ncbi:MAG: hypothetical protein ACOYMP_00675 [Nodosilinea sp.]
MFEPTSMRGIRLTDPFFAKALSDLSANNTLYFTPKQLFYFLEKRLSKKGRVTTGNTMLRCGCFLVFFGFFLAAVGMGWLVIGIGVVLMLMSGLQSKFQPKRPRTLLIGQSAVEDWLQRWSRVNAAPEKLLPPRQSMIPVQPVAPADVTAYSFDRLVVCDSVAVAHMLIANNFHFENNCAVLSISGYPEHLFETTMQMLRRNPDLRVFALHDCSPAGMEVVHRLQTEPIWFAEGSVVIVDVGLLPRQIMAARKDMSVQNSDRAAQAAKNLAPQIRQTLSQKELQWLEAGNMVELESFTPQTLLQILQRSIANSQEINQTDSGLLLAGGVVGGSYIYAADSFG